jgi:hypothetical protein
MVNMTLTMGHHAETWRTARNVLIFHKVAVRPTINCTIFFVTGEDDIARFDSRQYTVDQCFYFQLTFCNPDEPSIDSTRFCHSDGC